MPIVSRRYFNVIIINSIGFINWNLFNFLGSYCVDPSISPQPCPLGTAFSSIWSGYGISYGIQKCIQCPSGYYANKLGSALCTPCPAGNYCPIPTSAPIQCPKGTLLFEI